MSQYLISSLLLATLALAEPQATAPSSPTTTADAAAAAASAQSRAYFITVRTGHAAVLCVAFVFWFPLGAFLMRLMHNRWTLKAHIGVMLTAWALVVAGLGMGIWIALNNKNPLINRPHAVVGLVVLSLMLLQPLGGLLAHRRHRATGKPNVTGFGHAWLGRALLVLGAINGALGLQLAENSWEGNVAYAVLMSIVIFSYLVAVGATGGWKVGGQGWLGRRKPSSSSTSEEGMEKDIAG